MFTNTPPSYNTFSAPPFTNTQSVLLLLRPVETRAGSERGHEPRRPREGTRRDISSSYARRTEPFYLMVVPSSNSTDLSKKLHNRFLRDLLVDRVGRNSALQALPSPLRLSPGLPAQLLHHCHPPTGSARLKQPTTTNEFRLVGQRVVLIDTPRFRGEAALAPLSACYVL